MRIKFLQLKRKFKKGGSGVKPDLYWRCILSGSLVLVLGSLVFGLYLLLETNKELVLPVIDREGKEISIQKRLSETLQYFWEREKRSVDILDSPSPVIDPSL